MRDGGIVVIVVEAAIADSGEGSFDDPAVFEAHKSLFCRWPGNHLEKDFDFREGLTELAAIVRVGQHRF